MTDARPADDPLPRRAFWFLRHGETAYNARGLSQGAIDIPLNDTGRAQARAAARVLNDRGIVGIFCSPMRRARETAGIVNQTLNLPITFDDDLREAVFGGREGRALMPWYAEWIAGRVAIEGAETFMALTRRAAAAMRRVLDHPGPVLVVSHGGVFRALRDLMARPAEDRPTPNGVPLFCAPAAREWEIEEAGQVGDAGET